jgi:exosome complex exonuclease DIS3/RRP44
MNPQDFTRAFKAALKDPEIQADLGSIVGVQIREELALLRADLKAKDKVISQLSQKVSSLEVQVEALEQYSRRNCLRLAGAPETENEDVVEKTLQIFNDKMELDPPITIDEIDRIHRIGKKEDSKTRGIIVKFATYRSRRRVLDSRKKLKSDSVPLSEAMFLSEDLTRQRDKLLYEFRCLKRNKTIDDLWTHDGTVLIRDSHKRVRSAKTLPEIQELLRSLS